MYENIYMHEKFVCGAEVVRIQHEKILMLKL